MTEQKERMENQEEYEPCEYCGGKVVDNKPFYIPLGFSDVMVVIDQHCTKCGCRYAGKHQKIEIVENQKVHDLLFKLLSHSESRGCND